MSTYRVTFHFPCRPELKNIRILTEEELIYISNLIDSRPEFAVIALVETI